jgi:hypothetical protein
MTRRIRAVKRRTFVGLAILSAAIFAAPGSVFADFKVHTPDAETGEFELEEVGSYGRSGNPATDNEQSFVHELGYGVNNWWHTEVEFETERQAGPGNHLKFDQITSENQFVFTEPGEYWLDAGLFWEYGRGLTQGNPSETTFGPTLRNEVFHTINTVNLFLEKEFGATADGHFNFQYAWETRIALGTWVEPGFQAYGTTGPIGNSLPASQQDHRMGPQLFANLGPIGPGALKMNGGILFGLTPTAPRQTWRWQMEYELHF